MAGWMKSLFERGRDALKMQLLVEELLRLPPQAALAELRGRIPTLSDADFEMLVGVLEGKATSLQMQASAGPDSSYEIGMDASYVLTRMEHDARQRQRVELEAQAVASLIAGAQAIRAEARAQPSSPPPLDDLGRTRVFMEAQQRHAQAMMRTLPGSATPEVVAELESIVAEYDRVLELGPPSFPIYTLDDVRLRRADALEHAGRACDSLRDAARARELLGRAVSAYRELGDEERAAGAARALAAVEYDVSGDVDREIERLQGQLAAAAEGSMEHALAQLALGEAYMRGGDDFTAEPYLLQAQAELEALGHPDPTGADGGAVLLESLRALQAGTARAGSSPVETLVAVQGAYLRIYQSLSIIYKEREDLERAAEYSGRMQRLQERSLKPADLAPLLQAIQGLGGPGGAGGAGTIGGIR